MTAQICIKWHVFQLVNIANRFLRFFQARYTYSKYISEAAREPYFSTRIINLSKPHPKVIELFLNNSKNNVRHKKFEKFKMESKIKFNLIQRLQTGAKMVHQ